MEGLVKVSLCVAGAGIVVAGAYGAYKFLEWNQFNSYGLSWGAKFTFTPTAGSAKEYWERRTWVFRLTRGPGRDNVDRDLQEIVNMEESGIDAICPRCLCNRDGLIRRQVRND